MRLQRLLLVSFCVWLAGCSGFRSPTSVQPTQTIPATPQASRTTAPSNDAPTGTPAPPGPITLTLWLPPQFDLQSSTPAAEILKARLEEFSALHPEVRLEARTKAEEGPGGMLDSLASASAAAPLALPDLIALPRPLLEAAALKGLLYPYDKLTAVMGDADWYDYSRQVAILQSSTFGLPFAGDALVLAYRPERVSSPPATWKAALETQSPILFPADDPQSLVTLALYQAAGGKVLDDQGKPYLESEPLVRVLTFFQEAEQAGVMPFWITQFQNGDQVWAAMREGRADMAITWISETMNQPISDTAIAPLLTQDGKVFALATGWAWALSSPEPRNQELSVQLAEFLTESSFLARWNQAAGSLPPRPSSVKAWKDASLKPFLNQVALSAQLYPSTDVLAALGPLLEQATVDILKQQKQPADAVEAAIQALGGR